MPDIALAISASSTPSVSGVSGVSGVSEGRTRRTKLGRDRLVEHSRVALHAAIHPFTHPSSHKASAGNRRRFPVGRAAKLSSLYAPFRAHSLLPPGCHEPRQQGGGRGMNREEVDAQVVVVVVGSHDG